MSRILYVCAPDDTTLIPVATLTMRDKPPVVCPVCREPLTIVAPSRRPPHARHRSTTTCSMIRPESVAHIQTKRTLQSELMMDYIPFGRSLRFRGPDGSLRELPLQAGFTAQVEVPLRGVRFDVGILDAAGLPYFGIEVKDTHGVTPQKVAFLRSLGVPWIEVSTDPPSSPLTCLNWSF